MQDILNVLGIKDVNYGACSGNGKWSTNEEGGLLESYNPANGELIAKSAKWVTPSVKRKMH